MKIFLLFLLLSVFSAAQAQSQTADIRLAETQAHDEIVRILREKNIDFREQKLMRDYGAFGSSIETLFPARAGSDDASAYAGSANASAYAGSGYAGGLFVLAVPFTNINKRAVNPNGIS
ncbi:MAG: hypothetical protein LBJ35_04650, partial [Spirochaetaceae bacterium]|nr:hypothetical protein [Spirochaetaceae bacterium]